MAKVGVYEVVGTIWGPFLEDIFWELSLRSELGLENGVSLNASRLSYSQWYIIYWGQGLPRDYSLDCEYHCFVSVLVISLYHSGHC